MNQRTLDIKFFGIATGALEHKRGIRTMHEGCALEKIYARYVSAEQARYLQLRVPD